MLSDAITLIDMLSHQMYFKLSEVPALLRQVKKELPESPAKADVSCMQYSASI